MINKVAFCVEGFYTLFNPNAKGTPDLDTFKRVLEIIASLGYDGVEIVAPTLNPNPLSMSLAKRDAYRQAAEAVKLQIYAIHWLLAGQQGVHLTSLDPGVKVKTAKVIAELMDLAYDLDCEVVVHGSPKQRTLLPEVSQHEALLAATEVYLRVFDQLQPDNDVIACFEQLAWEETNFCNTMADLAHMVQVVDHHQFQGHLDIKAMARGYGSSPETVVSLIKKYTPIARHCHLNDPGNLSGPGCGEYDFQPVAAALKESGYPHWLSVEGFNFNELDPEETARTSISCIKTLWG
ncbi:MAG: sugar phosphate isomerase/epimerase family protein [Patescibacteria group bacterium]